MKNYIICLFNKNLRDRQIKEYVIIERPKIKSLDDFVAFTNSIRQQLDEWGGTSEGGVENEYTLTCEDMDAELTPEVFSALLSKLIEERGVLDKKLQENADKFNFLDHLPKSMKKKDTPDKKLEENTDKLSFLTDRPKTFE